MVRTRSKSMFVERLVERTADATAQIDVEELLKETIRKKAREMANSRLMNQTLSPSVRSRLKYKRKATRESMENENLLASVKEKFNKATDRTLANPVIEPKTPFEQILDAIKNGTARKKLKPSCEDMPNQI